jgi:hypothetical protein
MLVLAREIHHLRHLGLGDLVGEHAALPDSMMVDVEHDLRRGLDILLEKLLQHQNDKFHRRVIVVQYQDAVQVRALGLRFDLGDNRCRRAPGPGTDESNLEASCSMAQVFDIPTGNQITVR